MCQQLGWLVNLEKSELEPKQDFNFVGYQFVPQIWSGPTDSRPVAEPSRENAEIAIPTGLPGPGIQVRDRLTNGYRKASSCRPTSYETHSVASQTQLEGPRITGKGDPNPQVLAPPLQWWLKEDNVLTVQPLHPIRHALQIITDASIEGWGARLDERLQEQPGPLREASCI